MQRTVAFYTDDAKKKVWSQLNLLLLDMISLIIITAGLSPTILGEPAVI
jgi:hypothetical protein